MKRLQQALLNGWHLPVVWLSYVPEGGGSHHWKAIDRDGKAHFVTVDDLDNKDWMGITRETVFSGLRLALETASTLRCSLDFVVAPVPTRDGQLVWRLDDRYTISLFPFLDGKSLPVDAYRDTQLQNDVTDMIADLHQSTAIVREQASRLVLGFAGERHLRAFLREPWGRWQAGPFSEQAHVLLAERVVELTRLVAAFDRLALRTEPARRETVITHGEPHPANLLVVDGRLMLIDWHTVTLAPPERDLSVIATSSQGDSVERYRQATGWQVNLEIVTLYQVRWYIDDLAFSIRLFSTPHEDTADTRRWRDGLIPRLQQLTTWLDRLK